MPLFPLFKPLVECNLMPLISRESQLQKRLVLSLRRLTL
ncbi:hypothetical protein [Sulfolobus tengchongensis spindle-shaped virus 4]|nr:hypothetical protein [Sulfolobus tengchongensis spindle-shaped virus 4]